MSIARIEKQTTGQNKVTVTVNGRTFVVKTSLRTLRRVMRLHSQMLRDIERLSHRQLSELTGEPIETFSGLRGLDANEAVTEVLQAASIAVRSEKGSLNGL